MNNRQRVVLWAESIRDIGILLLVFGPLDVLLAAAHLTRSSWLLSLGFVIFGVLLIEIGIRMEADI